jgi:hypothetical protein
MEQNKEGDGFVRFRWGETKEQAAVGGSRLTIEIGAEFPIGISPQIQDPHLLRHNRYHRFPHPDNPGFLLSAHSPHFRWLS